MPNRVYCPIFPVSNVTGDGIELLKLFLAKLPIIDTYATAQNDDISKTVYDELVETEFIIDSTYNVKNVGFVVGGTVTKGEVKLNETLMMGPDKIGTFKGIMVKGIQENRVDIEVARRG